MNYVEMGKLIKLVEVKHPEMVDDQNKTNVLLPAARSFSLHSANTELALIVLKLEFSPVCL